MREFPLYFPNIPNFWPVVYMCEQFSLQFENFVVNYETAIEKVHTSFMKRTLDISKYASNKILYGKLARFPLLHNAWALGVKYWLSLCNGAKNVLLNQCFQLDVEENHNWFQSIQYLLCSNDFGNISSNPPDVGKFHKVFKTRLNDQFIQDSQRAISSSNRFSTRRELSVAFQLPEYINAIGNPGIRLIYTRLRTDPKVLSTCRASKKQSRMCPMCNTESETVSHFFLHCPYFTVERNNFYDCINPYSPYFSLNNESRKLSNILDLHCPPETIGYWCKYIESIYIRRERFALWYMWRYLSTCIYIHICIYICSA